MMAGRKISKIFCVVHPFYARRRSDAEARADLEYWKAVVDRVRGDPSAILVGVQPPLVGSHSRELRDYAKQRLGDRFWFSWTTDALSRVLSPEEKSGRLSKSVKVFACGEYYDGCVSQAASNLARGLNIPKERILLMPDLSVHFWGHKLPGEVPKLETRKRLSKQIEARYQAKSPVTEAELTRLGRLRGFSVVPRRKIRRPV